MASLFQTPRKSSRGSGFLFGRCLSFECAQQPKDNFGIYAAYRPTGRFFKLLTQIVIETERPGQWSTNIAFGSA
jgi:hypothetical protein